MSEKQTQTPIDIVILGIISICFFTFSLASHHILTKAQYKAIIPYTGWSPGSGYAPFIILLFIALTSAWTPKKLLLIRWLIIGSFAFQLVTNIMDWWTITPAEYTNPNPYLRYDPLRPLYSMGLPLFWILINGIMLVKERTRKL